MKRSVPVLFATVLVASELLAAPAPPAVDTGAAARAAILEHVAPAIVRVEAVLKTRVNVGGQGEEQDSRLDLIGALVDPGGLIMIWNSNISSNRVKEMMTAMQGGAMDWDIDVTPTGFEVLLPGASKEVGAFLAATDSNLDLAFLQLNETPAEPLPFVDFGRSRAPAVGEEVVAVTRLERSFDNAAVLASARIAGPVGKPRPAFALDGQLGTYGLPLFALSGEPVGALTTVFSRLGDEGSPFVGLGAMLGGHGMADGPIGTFVLPGNRVAAVIELARKEAARLLAARQSAAE